MLRVKLQISLFGASIVRVVGSDDIEIRGTKHKALFSLLSTAPFGRHTRTFLQETLWGRSCYDTGRQSLRRALSDIKKLLGKSYDDLLIANNSEITLNLSKVEFIGSPDAGQFLQGMEIHEERFEEWVQSIRQRPEQLRSLYATSNKSSVRPIVPTIAVLPFQLVHGDGQAIVLGDWLAEEVSRSLSKSNLLTVISHLSSRNLSGRNVDLGTVTKMLNADYIVTGSMRKLDQLCVLDVDLLNAQTGKIIWTRNFSEPIGAFLSADNEPVSNVVRSIGKSIASDTISHTCGRELHSIPDYQILLSGVSLMHEPRLRSFAKARTHITEAIKRSPRSAEAHAWLSEWYVMCVFNGWSTDLRADSQYAKDHAARALDIDPENSFGLTIDGVVHNNLFKQLDLAEQRFSKALEINPNEPLSWLFSGILDAYRDDGEAAVHKTEHARKLSPSDPFGYFYESLLSTAHYSAGNFETALSYAESSHSKHSAHVSTLRAKISALHGLGRTHELKELGVELLRKQPDFTIKQYLESHPSSNFRFGKRVTEALLAAGIPTGE